MQASNNPTPRRIAVLFGGVSAEAEVSRRSATQVAAALNQAGHQAETIELNAHCYQRLGELNPDVVFPALHGPPGEDGTVQGFLDILGFPYVGSDVPGSALAMDKAIAKEIFRQAQLPVTPHVIVSKQETDLTDAGNRITAELGSAVVIKPLNQGSAIGVTPLPNGGDVQSALATALTYGDCLVEPFILGKEITCGVLQLAEELIVHPVIEIVTETDEWYDYENRYTVGKSNHLIPAPLSRELSEKIQTIAKLAHQSLGLRDLSRADFIVTDNDDIILLEVNTLPGMTPTSLYPEGAEAIGYPFERLVHTLSEQAFQRGARYPRSD